MKTILVTGGAGFIAARCAEMLLAQGERVVVVDNLNSYYDLRLKCYRLRELARAAGAEAEFLARFDLHKGDAGTFVGPLNFCVGQLEFVQLDIEDKPALEALFSRCQFDAVVNLAARAGVRYSMLDPQVYMTTNAMGTLNLLDCMRDHKCKKMVLASTSSLYAGQEMPFSEELAVNTPISPYAASKKAAEVMAYSYHYLYALDISVVRYFTVYGPCGRPDMSIFRFIKWIDEGTPIELFGDGSQSRDFTYVDDIARGTLAALREVGYEIINLGGGNNPISINEVIRFIEQTLGKKALIAHKPFHIADIKETWADIAKADRLLDWQPQVAPYDGFKRSVDWYLENRDWLAAVQL
ncbi:NAD-dependent epimerase/dehydratase family protein [Geopsychrobacter electrodiphilus]|uniref:NAD-dependent epimerase/dehydratase family protein n=1 Tax=Geopsychrobacter electrodiphilus TaxID=225196 RepID=UPI000378C7A9|nr:NAD-dependent epimerase/dehydratase family protein [Geopsychrobacter electrodiphilus]